MKQEEHFALYQASSHIRVLEPYLLLEERTCGKAHQVLQDFLLHTHKPVLIVNMHQLQFMNSVGLSLMIRLFRQVQVAKGTFRLCAVPERVQELLEITKLADLLPVSPDLSRALEAPLA